MNTLYQDESRSLLTFARIPIFDEKKNLWGYAFKTITPGPKAGGGLAAERMAGAVPILDQLMDRGKKGMIGFSRKQIFQDLPYALPPDRTVVRLTSPDPDNLPQAFLDRLAKLKTEGYALAVPWSENHDRCRTVFAMADLICLDTAALTLPELTAVLRAAAPYRAAIMAERVDTQALFDLCARVGCGFFKGLFFKKPEPVSVRPVLAGTVSRFQLMKLIEQADPDVSELAAAIQSDVAVSFRLLTYLNSASFGFRRKIDSIRDAVTLLGWQSLKNWLRVVVVSEISENRHTEELVFLSAQRGKFLEQVGRSHDFWGFEPDSLFLLGMFSLLDALLNQPMTEILKHLPLPDKLKEALLMKDNNEYVPLLKLAGFLEEADLDRSEDMIARLGLDGDKIRLACRDARDWAAQLSDMQVSGRE